MPGLNGRSFGIPGIEIARFCCAPAKGVQRHKISRRNGILRDIFSSTYIFVVSIFYLLELRWCASVLTAFARQLSAVLRSLPLSTQAKSVLQSAHIYTTRRTECTNFILRD